MVVFTAIKCCAGALVAGSSIVVPALAVTQKWSLTSSKSNQRNQIPSSPDNKEFVTPEQIKKEKTFDQCMDKHLKEFQVRDNSSGSIIKVPSKELPKYLSNEFKWTIITSYDGQCQMQQ